MTRTIAIAGCTNHIGTTTQAIQAALAIKDRGLKVCYLEMNRTEYLNNVLKLYRDAMDEKKYIKFRDIDMYKSNFAKSVIQKDWDYVIRDYGSVNDKTFEETSYAEQPLKIVIAGSKPNEILKTTELLKNPVYEDAYFIFSFVPDNEKLPIKSAMSSRSSKTFFSDIILDPYELNPNSIKIYQKIINLNEGEN